MKIKDMDDAELIDEGNRCQTLAGLRACWAELVRRQLASFDPTGVEVPDELKTSDKAWAALQARDAGGDLRITSEPVRVDHYESIDVSDLAPEESPEDAQKPEQFSCPTCGGTGVVITGSTNVKCHCCAALAKQEQE